uniref:Dynein heavy chain hydrolytic ATP-binding dynein motor region domain-containing protein n=1 Tax=Sphaeramia orbicularis TaxID=375764 RepID=A0A672Y9Y6_9TELE
MRALTSLTLKHLCPQILVLAMKDMNIAKLTSVDLSLFTGIIQDLFPAVECPEMDYGKVSVLCRIKLLVTPFTVTKVIQLYEPKILAHSSILVGKTGSGKTVTWKTLQSALSALHHKDEPGFQLVYPLNPKAMSLGELYGGKDLFTNEWTDGVLSSLIRSTLDCIDGPVDTLWIESMNSVMDDNKVLTLVNGEEISLPEPVENLAMASPAAVSRCGVVYSDYSDLGWKPFVQSWLDKRQKVQHTRMFLDP